MRAYRRAGHKRCRHPSGVQNRAHQHATPALPATRARAESNCQPTLTGPHNVTICAHDRLRRRAHLAAPIGGYVRVQEDASHLAIGSAMGTSGCMNIRACLDPAMPASAADRAGLGAGHDRAEPTATNAAVGAAGERRWAVAALPRGARDGTARAWRGCAVRRPRPAVTLPAWGDLRPSPWRAACMVSRPR